MRKVLLLPIVGYVLLSAVPAHAQEGHPPTAKTTIDCHHLTVDPPADTGVTFAGSVNGVAYSVNATPTPGTHNSSADVAKLTTGTGPLTIVATPHFTVPENPYGVTSGPGVEVTVTLTCHAPPPTTTTTMSTTTTTTATTSTTRSTTTTTAKLTPAPPQLPRTGSSPLPAMAGGSAVLVGLTLALTRKRGRV